MQFYILSDYLSKLEVTSSRITITQILAELLRKIEVSETSQAVNLLLGRLAPGFKDIVFNVAEKTELAAFSVVYKKSNEEVKALYQKEGDLGNVAFTLAKAKGKVLSISEVYDRLYSIAQAEGVGSQDKKINLLADLLAVLSPLEAKYVARIPVGKLRLGFSDKTVLDSLSWMVAGNKSKKKSLEATYQVISDIALLAYRVKKEGLEKATYNPKPEVGVPIGAMLAQRLKSPEEMLSKMGRIVAVEPKLDGLRVQLHFDRKQNKVWAFSRNLNQIAWMFPELLELGKYVKADKVILDAEAIGIDERMQKMANFQTTMTRRRKHEIRKVAAKVAISFYVFDILYCNGTSLLGQTYSDRRKVLEKVVEQKKILALVDSQKVEEAKQITAIYGEMRAKGFEGIVVKNLASQYVPGRTGWRWVKMKEEETSKAQLADTVDCVVMGFSSGRGKRTQFGMGNFLAGVLDKENIKTITKVGTGLTDEQFRYLYAKLSKLIVKSKPEEYRVQRELVPDFWVEPSLVVELAADEITKSPSHTAGIALRFPRLVKIREDKGVSQITSVQEVKDLQKLQ